ncbi:hypothetical protein [Leuconostoc falkenbergense]|jgi:hypothetical protein|uniref:hypothetical protein n=1 Tax=Leuconostoc falkenbergense TaxID=2766470 RepID=UPI0015F020F0|nr:hypothetical protein [Leuconostoc falkenbergense]MDV3546565.1 hypothetical protein [Leuconostoc falkenbergense]
MTLKTAEYVMNISLLSSMLLSWIINALWFNVLASIVIAASLLNYFIIYKRQSSGDE